MAGGRFWTTGELDRLTAMVGRAGRVTMATDQPEKREPMTQEEFVERSGTLSPGICPFCRGDILHCPDAHAVDWDCLECGGAWRIKYARTMFGYTIVREAIR